MNQSIQYTPKSQASQLEKGFYLTNNAIEPILKGCEKEHGAFFLP